MRFFPLLLLLPLAVHAQPASNPTRAQRERLANILRSAETDPAAALAAARAVPVSERDTLLARWLGDQLVAREDWDGALDAYESGLAQSPDDLGLLLSHAQTALVSNQGRRAVPFLRAAIARAERDPRLLEALGLAAESSGDLLVAEQAYRASLLVADPPQAREGLGRILIAQRRLDEAEVLIRGLLDAHPDKLSLWRLYADLALARGDLLSAVARLESARRLGLAETADLRRLVELHLSLGRSEDVLDLKATSPDLLVDTNFRLRTAEGLAAAGSLDAASDLLQGMDSDSPEVARVRVRILLSSGETSEAVRLAEQALRAAPLDTSLLRLAGEARMASNNPREAALHFERLSRQPGYEARGLWLWGLAEARAGQTQRALELLEAARRVEDLPGIERAIGLLRRQVAAP